MSLTELAGLQISVVSKKEENFTQSDAAVFVLTHDDILRSGATSIPEALRLVPGFQVARIDANKWAVSTRGFIGRFSNKLLVLIDGRAVYSSLFSGVFWATQDILLEDVDRIEVIRGPGATLWGANAVNGVINVITRHSEETQGLLFFASAGTEERLSSAIRYGSRKGDRLSYRGYSKYTQRDAFVYSDGSRAADGWELFQGGFRADWENSPSNPMTLKADYYIGNLGHHMETIAPNPVRTVSYDFSGHVTGWNALFHSQKIFSNASVLNIQSYFDQFVRNESIVKGYINTLDLEVDYLFDIGRRNQMICGIGFRRIADRYDPSFAMDLSSSSKTQYLYSAFFQDDFQIINNRMRLTLGSKFEHREWTGFEYQPNFRILMTPNPLHTGWFAISRAVRTPSRAERNGRHLAYMERSELLSIPVVYGFQGNPDFKSESLTAIEAGYRYTPVNHLFVDLAVFSNHYDDLASVGLVSIQSIPPDDPEYILALTESDNKVRGYIVGFESLLEWKVATNWRLQFSYTYSKTQMQYFADGTGAYVDQVANIEGQIPRHQGFIRSFIDIPKGIRLDCNLRFMDKLPELGVRSYVNCDLRLGWQINKKVHLSLTGQNLMRAHVLEFIPELTYTSFAEIQRGIYTKLTISH